MGSRNDLRGPGFFDLDLGLGKTFPVYRESQPEVPRRRLQRFNHPNFQSPSFENNMDLIYPPESSASFPAP